MKTLKMMLHDLAPVFGFLAFLAAFAALFSLSVGLYIVMMEYPRASVLVLSGMLAMGVSFWVGSAIKRAAA